MILSIHNDLIKYDAARFDGSAGSYAGQGLCSVCPDHKGATHMNAKATRAYCDECAERLGNLILVAREEERIA